MVPGKSARSALAQRGCCSSMIAAQPRTPRPGLRALKRPSAGAGPPVTPVPKGKPGKRPLNGHARLGHLAPGYFAERRIQYTGSCSVTIFNAVIRIARLSFILPATLSDNPCLAKADRRGRRHPDLWLRGCSLWHRARCRSSHAFAARAGKPYWSARVLVWSFHVRSGDLLFRGARRRPDVRGQQGHGAQPLSVVIRA